MWAICLYLAIEEAILVIAVVHGLQLQLINLN